MEILLEQLNALTVITYKEERKALKTFYEYEIMNADDIEDSLIE